MLKKGTSKFFKKRKVVTLKSAREWASQFDEVIGFTGFTVPPERSNYMANAEDVVRISLQHAKRNPAVVYGSSDAGIDQIVEKVCAEEEFKHIPLLGITCWEYAPWVPDEQDRPPVVVCRLARKYADLFTDLINVLIVTGGRAHALTHDVAGSLAKGNNIVVCNCAPFVDGGEGSDVQNAAARLENNLKHITIPQLRQIP